MGTNPVIIQGGMGAGVSGWRLARAVSATGQLGVVSGTALDHILIRRLQDGDLEGDIRRGLEHFPFRNIAKRIVDKFYIPGGKTADQPYKLVPMHQKESARCVQEVCMAANFVEVWLAREGHDNPVGINYLEKVQMPHLASIYGAMLAGVGYVLMGAGIPIKIPAVLDRFVNHESATYPLNVSGAPAESESIMSLDPHDFMESELPPLTRPKFLAIISSSVLGATILKRANGRVDGFVIEGHSAGGHSAPPRGKLQLTAEGEAIYGERDDVDLSKIRELGLPFWLAGGYGSPEKVAEALAHGAAGVQVGTAFAYCTESGLREDYKQRLIAQVAAGDAHVFADPNSSPTGFPFKAARLHGSMSEREAYELRARVCDLGYLREAYQCADGTIGYRCSAEPVDSYVIKGGKVETTEGKKCLCNSLLANIGHPQVRGEYVEQGLVTSGKDLGSLARFIKADGTVGSAADVVKKLLAISS